MREHQEIPRCIKVAAADNVAVIVNDGGLKQGTVLPDGTVLQEDVPQGHKTALCAIAKGEAVIRYGEILGYALQDIPRGGMDQ